MDQLNLKIENFEGPLDLLLKLIARNRMTLLDVQLRLIIDQYLDFIGFIGPDQLDSASEFIEMAARLVYMKSIALLPRQEEIEELERELVGQLIEYQLCKQAALKLRYMQEGLYYIVRDTMEIDFKEDYKITHDKTQLAIALKALMSRTILISEKNLETFEEIVVAPVVSISSRMMHILRSLRRGVIQNVIDLFLTIRTKGESVATFLGLLELMNTKRVTVADDGSIVAISTIQKRNTSVEVSNLDG